METSIEIPNKSIFKLNEVCSLTGVKPYVLRFWESEFPEISPISSSSGQKLYEHKDIEAIALIKSLLFDQKMTIEQAKFELSKLINFEEETEILSYSQSNHLDSAENNLIEQEQIEAKQAIQSDFGRYLSDLEVQKLVLAKAKLNSIIGLIDSLQ